VSKALYRKYRSKSLDEIVGQKHITDILARSLLKKNVFHAYLFSGPRGVGKTSVARILAHAINDLEYDENSTHLDIIEIDAASNNGVEDVRDLREKVQIAPFSANKKVYIIDEVHMLSKAAFNALLKTLEEPPEHAVFILATTNAEKLPATIISRVQRFSFRPINLDDAVRHLSHIAKQEKINVSKDALRLIAERGDGSFRDSISLLDQLSSLVENGDKEITVKLIEDLLGLATSEMIKNILESVEKHDLDKLIKLLNRTYDEGVDGIVIAGQLNNEIRDRIAQKPELIPLLDQLIDVAKSPQPQLKLLSVLGLAAAPKQHPKTAALLASKHEVSATITELEKQAAKDHPTENTSQQTKGDFGAHDNLKSKTVKTKSINEKSISTQEPAIARPANSAKVSSEKFDWNKLIDYTRKNHVALYSVLSKCGHQLESNELTIYANNKFYKNKLDDVRYTSLIHECLQKIGVCGLVVHTIPTSIPPKDSQAAAVAAIMGGGVEVSLESA
jgi:DNA polymerase-3 subunit gamma/tau